MEYEPENEQELRQQILTYIQQLDPEVLGLRTPPQPRQMKVSRMATGESNTQFLLKIGERQYVIRMGLRLGNRVEAIKEFTLLQAATPLHIAPRPYYFDATCQSFPSDITILEWIDGKHVSQYRLHSRKFLEELAQLLTKLHTSDILHKALEPFCPAPDERPDYRAAARAELLDWAENSYQRLARFRHKYGLADDELMDLLRRCIRRERRRLDDTASLDGMLMVPTHGDIHIGNLLRQSNGRLVVIDWETASMQDPAFEFISLFTWEDFKLDEELFLIDKYQELTGFTGLHERIGTYQAIYLLGVVLDTALRAYLTFTGEIQTDPNVGRSLGFYRRDFFICLRNYLHWYTGDDRDVTIHDLHQLGHITPEDWNILEPADLFDDTIESSNGEHDEY